MGSGSEIDVGRVIDDAKLNKVSVTVIVLCGLIMLMDGYDYGIISVAAPMIRRSGTSGPRLREGVLRGVCGYCSARLSAAFSRTNSEKKDPDPRCLHLFHRDSPRLLLPFLEA